MSLMKIVKKSCYLFIFILTVLTFTSCNKIKKSNYEKIYIGMEKQEVIKILGLPNESRTQITYDIYYWFDNASSFEDAIKKDEDGKEVICIIIAFTPETDNKSTVTHKEYGSIKDFKGE